MGQNKKNDENLRRLYQFPKAFKNARVIRDGITRQIKETYQIDNAHERKSQYDALIKRLNDIDYKIDVLEIMYRSLFIDDDSESSYIECVGGEKIIFRDMVTDIITDCFNWMKLIPFKDNVDYIGSVYMLLYGKPEYISPTSDIVIQTHLDFLCNEFNELNKLKLNGNQTPSRLNFWYNELKDRLMKFIIIFTGHISLEELFKSFSFTSEELSRIIRSYSMYGKRFDWFDYFKGRYYSEMTNEVLFDIEVIAQYLKDDSSIKEKEEFVDSLIEFIEMLDREHEIIVEQSYLYGNDDYVISVLNRLHEVIQEDLEI